MIPQHHGVVAELVHRVDDRQGESGIRTNVAEVETGRIALNRVARIQQHQSRMLGSQLPQHWNKVGQPGWLAFRKQAGAAEVSVQVGGERKR